MNLEIIIILIKRLYLDHFIIVEKLTRRERSLFFQVYLLQELADSGSGGCVDGFVVGERAVGASPWLIAGSSLVVALGSLVVDGVLLEAGEQVVHLHLVGGLDGEIFLALDQVVGQVPLEELEAHYLLLQGVLEHQSVYIYGPLLANPMGSINGLHIFHGVPVVLHEDHGVCSDEVETQATDSSGEDQNSD